MGVQVSTNRWEAADSRRGKASAMASIPERSVSKAGRVRDGSTSSAYSAQFVKNLNAKEFAGQFPTAAVAIVENHYVDDYIDNMDTIEEVVKRAKEVRYVHFRGGFELRNWVSNSEEFLEVMGERKENQCVRFREDKESGFERVLGIVRRSGSTA